MGSRVDNSMQLDQGKYLGQTDWFKLAVEMALLPVKYRDVKMFAILPRRFRGRWFWLTPIVCYQKRVVGLVYKREYTPYWKWETISINLLGEGIKRESPYVICNTRSTINHLRDKSNGYSKRNSTQTLCRLTAVMDKSASVETAECPICLRLAQEREHND
jgi:hypothetical protein